MDRHGDTCLIALVKRWPDNGDIETLLRLIRHLAKDRDPKSNVNAYDRRGKTALSFAVERGNRSATDLLLELGANPNSTCVPPWHFNVSENATGSARTVLGWAETRRNEGRRKMDQMLYAAILECEKSLVLAGALRKVDPTEEFKILR